MLTEKVGIIFKHGPFVSDFAPPSPSLWRRCQGTRQGEGGVLNNYPFFGILYVMMVSQKIALLGVVSLVTLISVATQTPPVARAQQPTKTDKPTPPSELTAAQTQFFETKIRPVLFDSCVACHGKENTQGNLKLDTPDDLRKPSALLHLIERIKGEGGKPQMPQGGKPLAKEKITDIENWVKAGAFWPASLKVLTKAEKPPLWSLQPVRDPKVPTGKNAIDAFVGAQLSSKKLTLSPPADRRTLLRRVTYDLTGLPPTLDEARAFIGDKSPHAFEKVVDRLLNSPRYGERQARLWMDIARYADTKGYVFEEDRNYYNAYTYRDYLISSFNTDKPYDRFIIEQIAADRLDLGEDKRPLAAMGYLTLGRRFINNFHDITDDRIDVVTRGFQGLTVSCARCHDHKFDPIPTQDYYSLYSIFASSREESPIISPRAIAEPYEAYQKKVGALETEHNNTLKAETNALRERVKQEAARGTNMVANPLPMNVKAALQSVREDTLPKDKNRDTIESAFPEEKRTRLTQIRAELDTLRKAPPTQPEFAMAMVESNLNNQVVFKRGNPGNPGEAAPRRYLKCVVGESRPVFDKGSGRLELAQTIASPQNPLTARVMVNRIWAQHFGTGIVRTPSDFGYQGEKPTHPEVLDYLASRFMKEDAWSIKKLHKRILLSATYQQSAVIAPAIATTDPENRLYSHQNRRKLDMEQLRDSLLFASGKLDTTKIGGKSEELWGKEYSLRRAVYGKIERQNLPGIFKTFDFATPDAHSPQRFQTMVPQQGLFLLNSEIVNDQITQIATANKTQDKIVTLYQRVLGRTPTPEELSIGTRYLNAPEPRTTSEEAKTPLWQYGYGVFDPAQSRLTTFTPFTHFADGMWRVSDKLPDPVQNYLLLTAGGGHPGSGDAHVVVRRFIASQDGTLQITGKINHPSKDGDGIRALVLGPSGKIKDWFVAHGETNMEVSPFSIKKGQIIDFVAHCNANENSDTFIWTINLSLGNGKYGSERDFSGPVPQNIPLTRWERYTQALLLTNEFLFVD
jgi:cytochrome c553